MLKHLLLGIVSLLIQTEGLKNFEAECVPKQVLNVDASKYQQGYLYSPGGKEMKLYPNDMTCGFKLTTSWGMHIRLTFNLVDIKLSRLCRDHHLLIVNMDASNPEKYLTSPGLYCGSISVPDLISSTHEVQIRFLSGMFGSGKGFNISYSVVSSPDLCLPVEFKCRNRKCLPNKETLCNGEDDCGDGTDEENCDFPPINSGKCGISDINPADGTFSLDRIVGGREAISGSWPWQADLQDDILRPNGHFCGGTFLNTQWIVTAAHCFRNNRKPFEIRVHLGNHNKYVMDPFEQIRYVKEYYIYGVNIDDFITNGKYDIVHDLALIKLNAPVTLNPHVQPACPPVLNEEIKEGKICFATGWGMTRGSGDTDALKQALHPIQNQNKCKNVFQSFINKTMICAGQLDQGYGLCHGDSGGPLVCQKSQRWTVYGVASFVTDSNLITGLCGTKNRPTVFNKVAAKVDWIKSILE